MGVKICEKHRKELLRFLLLRTAAVRTGIKPGELLRIKHCYETRNEEGFQFCLYRHDIFNIINLHFIELSADKDSSLVLFFNPEIMQKTLKQKVNAELLSECGYPVQSDYKILLAELKKRFSITALPHEVGVFIGYPAKDVSGFMKKLPSTPVHRGLWRVCGDIVESVYLMNLYREAEMIAQKILDACDDLQSFFEQMAEVKISNVNMING